ncbi:MAG: FprA family A-type flavoprotein, partial [Hungatella sp.]|nr:FprA family A-type flavoprotein [Hungatella sp.]
DVSNTHPSVIISEAFRCSHLVFASATYNGGIFSSMEHLLLDMKAHNVQNRTVALMENGSWGIMAGKKMTEILSGMKNMTLLDQTITIKSSVKEDQLAEIGALANAIAESIK